MAEEDKVFPEKDTMEKREARRRPIRSRNSGWARVCASFLAMRGIAPNTISLFSMIFASLGGLCFVFSSECSWLWLAGALLAQGRLLCNLFDGMVAVEGWRASSLGELYNDLPDRVSDSVILICFGWGLPGWWGLLGWAAALCAALTAYVRVLGASCGLPPCFVGPMAKQHRMALITVGAAVLAFLPADASFPLRALILGTVIGGCMITVGRRLRIAARELTQRADDDVR